MTARVFISVLAYSQSCQRAGLLFHSQVNEIPASSKHCFDGQAPDIDKSQRAKKINLLRKKKSDIFRS